MEGSRKAIARLLCGVFAASVQLTGAAWAQEPSPSAQGADQLQDIVITARARAEALLDVPDSVTAFGADAIERAGMDEVYDLVRLTPGLSLVESSQSPGIALLNIRGIGQQLNQEAPVAVVVDGVQLASPAAITQALTDVERIEVLKGPQGALYGRNAIGGAINIITREPTNELSGYVEAGVATHDSYQLAGVVSGALVPDRLRVKLTGSWSDFGGDFRNAVTGRQTNPLRDWLVRGRTILDVSPDFSLDLRGSYSRTRNRGYNAVVLPGGDAGDFSTRPQSGSVGFGRREIAEVSLLARLRTRIGEVRSVTAYVDSLDESGYDLDQQPIDLISLDIQRSDVRAISQELRLTSDSDRPFRYTGGVYLLWTDFDRITQVTLFPPVTGAPVPITLGTDAVQDNFAWALFGQINYDILPMVELTLAGRYDRDRRRQLDRISGNRVGASFSRFQPKASLAFRPNRDLNIYATYAEGFRSGGFNQPTPAFPNVYDQEQTRSFELGVKSQLLERRLRLNAALFHTTQRGQQVTLVDVQNTGAQGIVNIDRTRFQGAEVELAARIARGLTFTGGATYIDSEITRFARAPQFIGNRSPYTPQWSLSAAVDYETDVGGGWNLALHADYGGQSGLFYEYFGSVRQPAYGLVNLRIGLHNEWVRVEAYAENAFDTKYYADVASNFVTGGLGDLGIRGRGSRYGGRVRLSF